jgi:hypothetical protein
MRLVAATVLAAAGTLGAGEWIGRTTERFTAPEGNGLSRPRVLATARPLSFPLDLDRDGDLDVFRVYRGTKQGLIEALCRRSSNRLASVWKDTLPPQANDLVTRPHVGRFTDDRWPGLVVELVGPPYLAFYAGLGDASFSLRPVWLSRRFPIRYYRAGTRIEPYVSVHAVLDWDGDGYEDLVTVVRDAALDAQDRVKTQRHGVYVAYGGDRWRQDAVEVLDLAALGRGARILALQDFDGDGSIEILVEVEQIRGGTIRVHELLFLRKTAKIVQEKSWSLVESRLEPAAVRDLNGDGVPDVVFADHVRNHILVLHTDRRRGGGFVFSVHRVPLPPTAYNGGGERVTVYVDDLDQDERPDLFTVAAHHNQVHMVLRRAEKPAETALVFLPRLSKAAGVPDAGWFDKAVWFGDADGDGLRELLVLTNQVLEPEFVPPPGETPDEAVRFLLKEGDERKHYAPYFRLLVYRVRAGAVDLVATFNTRLRARSYRPERIVLQEFEEPRELVLEAVERESGRPAQAVFKITGRLPLKQSDPPGAEAPPATEEQSPGP